MMKKADQDAAFKMIFWVLPVKESDLLLACVG